MALFQITDYAARVVARVTQQLKRSISFAGLLTAFAAEIQTIEDALWTILHTRDLNLATGVVLDGIGAIVGATRDGLDDTAYLLLIRAHILINRRSGEIETLIALCPLIIPGATARLVEFDLPVVHIYLENVTVDYTTASRVAALLRTAKASGVRLLLIWQPVDDASTFTFAGGGGLGFGDSADSAVGGQLAGSA